MAEEETYSGFIFFPYFLSDLIFYCIVLYCIITEPEPMTSACFSSGVRLYESGEKTSKGPSYFLMHIWIQQISTGRESLGPVQPFPVFCITKPVQIVFFSVCRTSPWWNPIFLCFASQTDSASCGQEWAEEERGTFCKVHLSQSLVHSSELLLQHFVVCLVFSFPVFHCILSPSV